MFLEVVNFSKIYEKIQEAKTLQAYILETEQRIDAAVSAMTSLGLKTRNLGKIVQDIDKSNKPISQISFSKNAAGVVSISNNLADAVLDSQLRPIISTLLGRNIKASSIDKSAIGAIKKDVAKYGMKASDFDAIMKNMFTPGQNPEDLTYMIYTADGYIVSYEEIQDFGSGGSGGSGGGGSNNLDEFYIGSDPRTAFFTEFISFSESSSSPRPPHMLSWIVNPIFPFAEYSNSLGPLARMIAYGFRFLRFLFPQNATFEDLLTSSQSPENTEFPRITAYPAFKILKSKLTAVPEQITMRNYVSNIIPGGATLDLDVVESDNNFIKSFVIYNPAPSSFPSGVIGYEYTLGRISSVNDPDYHIYGFENFLIATPTVIEGEVPTSGQGVTIKSVVSAGDEILGTAYYGYKGPLARSLFGGSSVDGSRMTFSESVSFTNIFMKSLSPQLPYNIIHPVQDNSAWDNYEENLTSKGFTSLSGLESDAALALMITQAKVLKLDRLKYYDAPEVILMENSIYIFFTNELQEISGTKVFEFDPPLPGSIKKAYIPSICPVQETSYSFMQNYVLTLMTSDESYHYYKIASTNNSSNDSMPNNDIPVSAIIKTQVMIQGIAESVTVCYGIEFETNNSGGGGSGGDNTQVTFRGFIFVPNDSSKPNWILAGERLQSAPIPHNGASETKTTFDVPAGMKLRFDWGVDSESTYDSLDIWLDEQLVVGDGLPNGLESGSRQGTYTTPSELSVGSHTLVLKYRKDEIVASGQDAAWLTDISLIPAEDGNGGGDGENGEPGPYEELATVIDAAFHFPNNFSQPQYLNAILYEDHDYKTIEVYLEGITERLDSSYNPESYFSFFVEVSVPGNDVDPDAFRNKLLIEFDSSFALDGSGNFVETKTYAAATYYQTSRYVPGQDPLVISPGRYQFQAIGGGNILMRRGSHTAKIMYSSDGGNSVPWTQIGQFKVQIGPWFAQ